MTRAESVMILTASFKSRPGDGEISASVRLLEDWARSSNEEMPTDELNVILHGSWDRNKYVAAYIYRLWEVALACRGQGGERLCWKAFEEIEHEWLGLSK